MQVRSNYTILRGITAIFLILSLLISTLGVHIDYAICGTTLEHVNIMHKSEGKSSCCAKKVDDTCCTTQEIVQQASVYDFLVNSYYKVLQPAGVAVHFCTTAASANWSSTRPVIYYKPPPPITNRQSVFQVFLC